MSVTTRNLYTEYTVGYTLVGKGSVTGATTKVSFAFTATDTIFGIVQGHTINVYVNGPKRRFPGRQTRRLHTWAPPIRPR